MTWFRVDDGFSDHPKVKAIPRAQRAAACGLWVLAGSWSSAKLTEGRIPKSMVAEWGCSLRSAEALVEVGLWRVEDGGYVFHDWTQANPTKGQVLADRASAAERQRRAREKASSQRESQRESRRDGTVVSRRDGGVSHGPPVPSRPVSTSVVISPHQGDARVDGPTDDDLEAWTPDPAPAGVDLAVERRRFREHNTGAWDTLRDPRRAWLGWLRTAGQRQTEADRPTPVPGRPTCPIHPDQPTGSQQCPTCAAEAAPAPDLRAALRRTPKEIPA